MDAETLDRIVEKIIALQEGRLSRPEIVELFQELYDKDLIGDLPQAYNKFGMKLIDEGLVKVPERWLQ